jgi:hypothetical protein
MTNLSKPLLTALLSLSIFTSAQAKGVANFGTFKGNITDYYPNINIKHVYQNSVSGTTGNRESIYLRLNNADITSKKRLANDASSRCSAQHYFAIDNYEITYSTIGQAGNIIFQSSANIICFDK